MERTMNDFLTYLVAIRNMSPNTVRSYQSQLSEALAVFRSLVGTAKPSLAQLTPAILLDYVATISRREIEPSTICHKIAAIRSWCAWLERQGRLAENPALGLRGPRKPKKLPRFLSYQDVMKILSAPRRDCPFGSRDLSILHVLYSSGLRPSEVIGLDMQDLDLNEGLVKVRFTKSGRDRFSVLGPPAIEATSRWLQFRRRIATIIDPAPLYLNCDGQRLARDSVRRIFRQYAEAAKLPQHYSARAIRHTFASHLLANGADLASIKDLLGHSQLQTTTIYANLVPAQLWEVLEQKHPRA